MKVGILTFHDACNYGAVLQAYALSQWLKMNKIDVEIIDYQSVVFNKYKTFRTHLYKQAPYMLGVDVIKYFGKKKRNKNFTVFKNNYLPVSREKYYLNEDFTGITDKYDYFICGSDQVWNPELTKGCDPVYFLDFVTDNKKKIAYAPSVALKKLNEFQIAKMAGYLSSFDSLSIREKEAIDILQPYCARKIIQTCDPVFLPESNVYDNICSNKYDGKKFIFLYIVGRAVTFKNVISYAEKLSKGRGIELFYLIDGDKALYKIYGTDVFGCSPSDFLSLIKNAAFVISNSFHATAFSIIFAKQFFTFLKDGTGSRMVNLLNAFNLNDRILDNNHQEDLKPKEINYSGLKDMLNNYRTNSVDYLKTSLGMKPKENYIFNAEEVMGHEQDYKELLAFVESRRHCYLVRHKDLQVLAKSRSGGVFTALSDRVLLHGGAVYGCSMAKNDMSKAVHQRAVTYEERDFFRKSKYIQSDMRNCFKEIKKDLRDGLTVLFSGTGCQVAGLYGFLQGEDTANLYTVDIVCHGTPSPRLWAHYLSWMKQKYGERITSVNFRDKRYGWKSHLETVGIDNKLYSTSTYRVLFLKNAFLRPCCYECPFASLHRKSDITIGDAWGVEKSRSKLNDDKGCSLVLVNSDKGKKLFEECLTVLEVEPANLEEFLQPNLYNPSTRPPKRQKYWDCLNNEGFASLAEKYGKAGPLRRLKDAKLVWKWKFR